MDENIIRYYEYLKSKGLDVPPTVEQFQSTLQDKAVSDKYYAYLQDKKASMPNLDIAPDANSFYNTLKKKEEQAPQEQLQSQQEQGQEQPQDGMVSLSAIPSLVSKSAGQGRYAGGLTAANIGQAETMLESQAKAIKSGQDAYADLRKIDQGTDLNQDQADLRRINIAAPTEERGPKFAIPPTKDIKADLYGRIAPNAKTSLNLADLEARLSNEISKVPTGTTSPELIGLKNEIETKYKLLESDYMSFLESTDRSKFNNYSSRLSTIQEKDGDLSLEDEKFLKAFREESINIRKTADQLKIENIRMSADFDKWNKMSPLILNEAKKIQNELSKYVNEDGSYKSVADAQKAKALSSKLDEVKRSLIQLQEQTGVTSKVIDDINASYDSLIDNELIESQEWDKYTEIRKAERLSEEEKQARVKIAEEGNAAQKAALVLMSFMDTIGSGVVSTAQAPKVLADAFGSSDEYGWTDALYDISTDINTKAAGRTQALDSKSSVMNVMDIFAKGAGNVVQFAAGGGMTGALKAGSKLAANAGVAGTAYLMSVGDEYRQALEAGVDPQEAAIYANMISIATAMTEVAVPDFKYFTPADRKSIIAAMANKGIGAKEAFKGFAKNIIIEAPKSGLKEAGEEVLTELTGSTVKEFINAAKGERLYKDTFNPESMYEAALSGFIVGGGLQSIKRGVAPSDEELPVPRSIGENADAVIQAITMIDPSMASEASKDIGEIKKIVTGLNGIPAYQDLGDNEKNFVVYQLMKKRNLESAMKETGMSDEATISEIKKIESEINEVYAGKKVKLNNQKQNAIQEQAASEIPLQPEAGVGEEVEQGEPQAEPEVVTEEGVKEKVSVLDSPDTITESIVALTPEEKAGVTFLREDGTEVDIDGNEDELANAYIAATQIAENDRTDSQRSAIQAVEASLADEIQAEQLDAIVEQEAETDLPSLAQTKKEDNIKRRRKAAWADVDLNDPNTYYGYYVLDEEDEYGGIKTERITGNSEKEVLDKINAKYDNELAELKANKNQTPRFRLDDDVTNQEIVTVENNNVIKQNKIEGGLLNEQQSAELQKEIESKYNTDGLKLGPENEDIRTNIYNYDNPLAQKNVNGVNLRIAQGLLEKDKSGKKRSTYLLYADGKIAGKFYSVDDIKKVVKLIEDNLVKNIGEGTQESKFRLDAQKEGKADEKIVKAMKAMPTEEKQFVEPSGLYGEVTVDAIGESKSSTKEQDSADLVKALGLKSIDELNKRIEDFNGMPVILGMSDILGSGTYTDSMGNPMPVNGGILFGAFGGNTDLAWAGVQRNGAENQLNEAIALYNKNKELFDRLWKEGKLPMGHVPMVIMRMGDTAVNSNEAAFRWLAPYVASLPTKNRKDALNSLKDVLSKKVDNDSAASWLVDFNSSVASGEFSTKEEIVEALEEMLASKETQSIEKKRKSVEAVLNAVKKKKTTEEAIEYLENKTERILSYIVLNHIKNNKITTLDGLLNSVVEESNKRAKGDNTAMSLPVRSFVFSLVYSKGSPKTPSLAPIKALMNGVKNFKSEYFTTDFLYNAIGEPSMLKAKQGDTVAVVGIDVLNPEVKATNHPNYGFGPKGRLIATISNPTQGIEVFPEFKAKASRIFKKTTGKRATYPDPEKVAAQVGGAFFMDKAFRGAKIMKGEIDDLNLLIGKLRFAFPNVSVATTQEEFDEILKDETVRKRVKEGKVIYGVTKNGKIYINPSERSLATPIHEFGHIWIDYLRSDASGKKGTELLKKGLSLVEGTKEYKDAVRKYGDTELAKEEALVELMATKGSTIINSAKKAGFLSWMNAVFKFIKETFVANSKSVTYDQIKTLSIDEFINIGLADLFRGSEVSAKFSASQAEQASKARLSAGNNMKTAVSIIERGRANGISDKAITISLSRKGFTADEIDTAFKSTTRTLSKAALSEETLPGYDVLMEKVKKEAEASSKKGRAEINKALENSIKTIQAGKIYAAATDVQREQLIREVRRTFKKREKSAPSAYSILTGVSNIKKITIAEADLYKQQLMDYEGGAKSALKAWTAKGKALSNEMRELASKKKITLIQAAVVMKKFSRVNMFDEDSVDDFIIYMKKVFSDAEYADRISKLSSLLPKAKNNIDKKIGIARNLQAPLRRMLAINPSFVPDDVLSTYENIVKMFAQSGAVITPAERSSVIDDVNKVLLSVDEKSNKITEMSMILDEFENKVFDENGVLNYPETTKAMLKDDLITVEDYEFMRDNKRSINKTIKDANKVVSQADQDAKAAKQQEEKEALINSIKSSSIVLSDMFSEDEKKLGKDLAELIKTDAIESLTNSELNNLYKLIQTINNGYMPSYAYRIKSKLSSIINAAPVTQAISKSGIAVISKAVAGAKSLFSKKRDTVLQAIRRGTLLDIDKTLGNFVSRPIFDNIFRKSTQAQAKLKAGTNSIRQRMDDAAEAVLKSLNNNGNAFVESSFKTYAYMIQLEYESNKGSKSVNPASKFIDATIVAINKGKTKFSEKDAAILEKIKEKYSTDGEIDVKKLYDSFNSAEKKAIRVAQAIDKSVVDKAEFTAVVIRGEKFTAINNHIHLNTIKEDEKSDIAAASQVVTDYQKSTRPSSKSMSLVSRTGEVSPLNFDFYAAVKKGSTSVLVDYYMTPAIREAKQTINQVVKNLEEKQGGITKDERKVINAISKAYDEATENLLLNSFVDDSITAKAINILSKNGYRAALAGIPRATAELASNLAYATIVDLNAMATAYKYRDIIMSSAGLDVMLNSDSFQSNRVYSGQTLSGKLIDSNLLSQVAGMGDTRAKADVVNRMQQIYNMTAKKYVNSVEFIADTLISTPDKMIIRPIWFGSFANEFKKVTGSNVDFEKIASNDKAYMEKYKDAIARSREVADDASVMAGASDNAYTGILKGVIKPNQNAFARSMNIFNNYMTRFVTYEYLASRTAINALVGNGTISPMRGAAILAGVTSRMMVYTMLTKVLGGAMTSLVLGALGFDYEDEDEEKTALQLAGQSIGSALTSLLVGRDFGNVARNILNYGVEYVNANYLEDLRTGEYDPYKDSMQMSIIPQDPSKMKAEKMIQSVAGPLAPAVGTGIFVIKKIAEEPKKEKEAIERSDIETNVMIPLKIAGTLGLVPLYKDINKAVNDYTYQSLRDEDKGSSEPPMSKELMKKYYPDLYNKMYKSNPAKEQQEKRIKDRKEMIKKRKEDAIKSKLRR